MNDNTIKELSTDLKEYAQVQAKILELEINVKLSTAVASAVSGLIIGFALLLAFSFINIGIGLYLSDLLGSYTMGFLSIGIFYIVLTAIFYFFRESLLFSPMRERIISSLKK